MDPIEKVEDRNCYYTDNSSGIHCSYRKSDQKNIYKEIEQFNFPIEIVNIANKLYVSVVRDFKSSFPFAQGSCFRLLSLTHINQLEILKYQKNFRKFSEYHEVIWQME